MKAGIIIPFRDTPNHERAEELSVLVGRVHEICSHNNQDYQVFVVHQDDNQLFNKGSLMNVGADLAQGCDYFIFHDVDNIPIGIDNVYRCRDFTGNICGEIDGVKYYDKDDHFGDVVFFKKDDYFAINGISNYYWGWGWEVSATPRRLEKAGITFKRGDGVFKTIKHDTSHRFTGNPNHANNAVIFMMCDTEMMEGYRELKYKVNKQIDCNYFVDIGKPQYDITKHLNSKQIEDWIGHCDVNKLNWILETYSK